MRQETASALHSDVSSALGESTACLGVSTHHLDAATSRHRASDPSTTAPVHQRLFVTPSSQSQRPRRAMSAASAAAAARKAPTSAAASAAVGASASALPSPPSPAAASAPSYRVDAATSSLAFPLPLRPAPTFYPTEAEFADPIAYVQKIRHIGEKTGQRTHRQRGGGHRER